MKKDLRLAADVLPAEQLSSLSQSLIEQASDRGMGSDDVVAITAILESAMDDQAS
jgi:3-hydroxyisobutyrate dehydrogenase-like beta-hydroxyacid dehydrogenase